MSQLLKVLIYSWFIITIFESPFRYLFYLGGVPQLIYIKDVIILTILLIGLFHIFVKREISKHMLISIIIFVWGTIFAFINKLNFYQIVLGLKIFSPFMVGFILVYYFPETIQKMFKMSKYLILIVFTGLIMDYYIKFPWQGLNYSIMSYNIEGNRSWTTFGIERLSGFQRSSFDASILMYVFLLFNYMNRFLNNNKSGYSTLLNILLYFIGIVGVLLTTSKSAALALVAFLILISLFQFFKYFKTVSIIMIKLILTCLFLIGIIPPLIVIIGQGLYSGTTLNIINIISQEKYELFFASYLERIYNTWPNSFDLLISSYTPFFGRGIGGIGVSQQFFEPLKYNFADNIYVYLIVTFGIVALIIFSNFAIFLIKFKYLNSKNCLYLLMLSTIFTFGSTINFVESSALILLTGILLALQQRIMYIKNLT